MLYTSVKVQYNKFRLLPTDAVRLVIKLKVTFNSRLLAGIAIKRASCCSYGAILD